RALKRWQKAHGLAADGVIGPQTLAALGLDGRARGASSATPTPEGGAAAPAPVAATPAPAGDLATVLAAIAACESGGDPTPATTAFSGTSLVTTVLVPITALSPTVAPRSTHAP